MDEREIEERFVESLFRDLSGDDVEPIEVVPTGFDYDCYPTEITWEELLAQREASKGSDCVEDLPF